jgi:hypothetical protein
MRGTISFRSETYVNPDIAKLLSVQKKGPPQSFASMRQAGDYFNVVRVRHGVKSVSHN